MKILFVHRDLPGQFRHLAPALASDPGNTVVFLAERMIETPPGVTVGVYKPRREAHSQTHGYLNMTENAVLHGQDVARRCLKMARAGFRPDIMIAHPGWGGALFLKDVFPNTPLLNYCEFYYRALGADIGFDPGTPSDLDTVCAARVRDAHLLLSLEACDHGMSPTNWQRACHPVALQPKISVVFDGIDTEVVRPDAAARVVLPNGRVVTPDDEIVTFVARDLEPYRGFPSFMRALPDIFRARRNAIALIVGGDGVSYGRPPAKGGTWRQAITEALSELDPARMHFLGKLSYADYLSVLLVSSVHVYLTIPFVLSWSFMEALASGCVVVGSRTAPVEEVLRDGVNGFLADFHTPADIAARVVTALRERRDLTAIRTAARETVLDSYSLTRCLPEQYRIIKAVASG